MKIGIIVAMDKELAQMKSLLNDTNEERFNHTDFICGKIGENDIILQKCGIGKVNSTIGTVEMIEHYHPELIISSGVAGGADASLNVKEVVVGTEYVYHDAYCGTECEFGQIMGLPAKYHSPKELIEKAENLNCQIPIHCGMIVSGEWFVDNKEKMKEILDNFPNAKAVDMESCSIAQTCYIYKVPFISFRIISDVPLNDNKAKQYFNFWNEMAEGSFNILTSFLKTL